MGDENLSCSSPHTYQLLAAAHNRSCFSPPQLSGLRCHQCLPLNGFGFGCHGDHHHEAVQMDSWAGGSAPGAGPGSPPLQHAPVALRPGARRPRPPVWMTVGPVERGAGASLWSKDRRNVYVSRTCGLNQHIYTYTLAQEYIKHTFLMVKTKCIISKHLSCPTTGRLSN